MPSLPPPSTSAGVTVCSILIAHHFGIVGPNGAGKTTTIEAVVGLRKPDSGQIEVLGLDQRRHARELRHRIGVQFQESSLQPRIKVWEALDLFASFYSHPVDWRKLLERLELADKAEAYFAKLSGGQKKRLFIALSLINNPELIFLDELTTGLDPQARRAMWSLVREIRSQGRTILLTTHYIEEAEQLCDRVAIMNHGQIVAMDSPAELIRSFGSESRVLFTVNGNYDPQYLDRIAGVTRVDAIGGRVIVYGRGERLVVDVINTLSSNGFHFRDLRTDQPTLEDVFLSLTGQRVGD